MEESRHRFLRVEHSLVHVHVEHLSAALYLLASNLQACIVIAGQDQARELARPGDVGPLTNVYEDAVGPDGEWLQPAQSQSGRQRWWHARRQPCDRLGNGFDVGRSRSAATPHEVNQTTLGELAENAGHVLG